jgi:glutamyl endopeptidase
MDDRIKQLPNSLESPFFDQEILPTEPQQELTTRVISLVEESPFEKISIHSGGTESFALTQEADLDEWAPESERLWDTEDEDTYEYRTEVNEELEAEFAHNDTEVEEISAGEEEQAPLTEEEKGIIGDHDERSPVNDTLAVPFRWVCRIWIQSTIKFGAGHEEKTGLAPLATGVLISPRHVLTVAHVLHGVKQPGSVTEEHKAIHVEVAPAANEDLRPLGRIEATSWKIASKWKPGSGSNEWDYALITLKEPVGDRMFKELNGMRLCYWGSPACGANTSLDAAPSALLRQIIGARVVTAGYPVIGTGGMVSAAGQFSAGTTSAHLTNDRVVEDWVRRTGTFFVTADAAEGQSGSPVWIEDNGKRYMIGILAAIGDDYNTVVNLRENVLRDLRSWMAKDAPRTRPVERRIALEIPYRWVCRLEVYDNDLRRNVGYGSGLLISNRHVLTSARLIYEYSRNRRKYAVRVTPGYEPGKQAFGSTTASQARVSPTFSPATKDGSADYGLLTLSRPIGNAVVSSIGNSALGYWGNESHGISTTEADLRGKAAHIAAFSRLSGGGGLYQKLRGSTGAIVGLQRGQILHRASSKLDAPGAPIWIEAGKSRLLVGIASSLFSKDSELNLGCYLSQGTQYQLMQWINADHEQTELEIRDLSQYELEFVSSSPEIEAEDWIGETNPEPETQYEYLEAESKGGFFVDGETEDVEDLYSQFHEHELDQGEELAELKETQSLESDGEKLDWLTEGSGEEESKRNEEEIEGEDPQQIINGLINKGMSENDITNEVFYQRNPILRGKALRTGSRQAQQWQSIRDREVRPALKRLLGSWIADPMLLAIFFSQYEGDSRVPADATEQFLTRAPLLSMGKTLRDRILWLWRSGKPPVTLDRLYELAYEVSGRPGSAMLLCHNVTKAFARGGAAITWDRVPTAPDTYSDGKNIFTPKVIHPAGKLTKTYSKKYKRDIPSIYYLLFSEKELGAYDPGDWYHYYVAATMTAYSAAGELSPSAPVRELEDHEDRTTGPIVDVIYPGLVRDRLLDLESQMSNPDLVDSPGYRGWVLANVVSFLEGGHYGDKQEDVARESRFHLRGALAGLRTAGIKPGKNWVWYVPAAKSLSEQNLANGFLLQHKSAEALDASGQPFRPPKKGAK